MLLVRRLLVALFACVLVGPVQAWGPLGHAIVADLAQRHLDAGALAQVQRLLAADHADSLAAIASWPDQIQNDPVQAALWKQTRSQHYVNLQGPGCDYVPPRDCRADQCVIGALAHYVTVLGDRTQGDAVRGEALKFVVHFVGDVHQPLHAGYRDDRGGNTYQVQFDGAGSNLHRVWDSGLLNRRALAAPAYARLLDARGPVRLPAPIAPHGEVYAQWARESCLLTAQPGFYPPGHAIDQTYVDVELPVAELRLREAGQRLATVLNAALGGSTGVPRGR